MIQAIKVWALRLFYRFSSARAWRGHAGTPHSDLEIPVNAAVLPARLYRSESGIDKPLIVYFHGGGWVLGDLNTHHPFCQALCAATGCGVVAVDYRLAPGHRFPTAQEDCLAATRWIAQHHGQLGPNSGRLVIAGDSAGGNLATCTCLEVDADTRGKILGEVLIYPATDHYTGAHVSYVERATGQLLTASLMRWFWDTYLGDLPAGAPAAQRAFPLHSAALGTLPPTLLVTAEKDPIRDEGRAYAAKLTREGVQVSAHHFDDAEHGFACSQGPSADFHRFVQQLTSWLAQLN
jgi:acetyl esterase